MARVTVEDCVERVPNRFELVMLAAQRARDISAGAPMTLDRDNDKNPVVALREIADATISTDQLGESLVRGHQRHAGAEEPDEEIVDLMAGEEEWLRQAAPEAAEAPDEEAAEAPDEEAAEQTVEATDAEEPDEERDPVGGYDDSQAAELEEIEAGMDNLPSSLIEDDRDL